MNLNTGEVLGISVEDGTRGAKVKIGEEFLTAPLAVLMDDRAGNEGLVRSEVTLLKADSRTGKDGEYVPGNPG